MLANPAVPVHPWSNPMKKLAALLVAAALISPVFAQDTKKPEVVKTETAPKAEKKAAKAETTAAKEIGRAHV